MVSILKAYHCSTVGYMCRVDSVYAISRCVDCASITGARKPLEMLMVLGTDGRMERYLLGNVRQALTKLQQLLPWVLPAIIGRMDDIDFNRAGAASRRITVVCRDRHG